MTHEPGIGLNHRCHETPFLLLLLLGLWIGTWWWGGGGLVGGWHKVGRGTFWQVVRGFLIGCGVGWGGGAESGSLVLTGRARLVTITSSFDSSERA